MKNNSPRNRKKKWGVRDFVLDRREKPHLRKQLIIKENQDIDSLEHLNLNPEENLEKHFAYGEHKGDRKRIKTGKIRITTYQHFPSPDSINHFSKRLTRKKRRANNHSDRKEYWKLFYPERNHETRIEKETRIKNSKKKQPILLRTKAEDTMEFEYNGDLVVATFYAYMFGHAIYVDLVGNHWAFVDGKLDFVSPSLEDLMFMLTI